MKINAKYFNQINTAPKEVQEFDGKTVEIYSFNDYPSLYTTYTNKKTFTMWSCNGDEHYKLLIDDGYHDVMGELYSEKVNSIWIQFYKDFHESKRKTIFTIFMPIGIIVFAILALVFFVLDLEDNVNTYIMIGVLIGFFVLNKFISNIVMERNKKINQGAILKVKNAVGDTTFDSLLDAQESYVNEFFKKQYVAMYGEEGYDDEVTDEEVTEEETVTLPDANEELNEIETSATTELTESDELKDQ
ncbi:MAG: hypothetical protein R3Y60_01220 [bacterium]